MSKPVIPKDAELAKIFGDNTRIFRAMRELFKQAGDLSPTAIEEALIAAGDADNKAVQALDILERIANAVELSSLSPQKETVKDDDLAPRQENIRNDDDLTPRTEIVTSDDLSELSPVADQVGTDNSTDVTLVGSPNYITIVGQVITRALINLVSHVTGILPLLNGGTGDAAVTSANIGHLKAMNQDVGSTSDPTFGEITASTGINLGGTAAINLLDDFEKDGNFTPTLQDASFSDSEGQGYSVQKGTFSLVGTRCDYDILMIMNNLGTLTPGNQATIGNMPFVSKSTSLKHAAVTIGARSNGFSLSVAGAVPCGVIFNNTNRIGLEVWDTTGGTTLMTVAEVSATGRFTITGSYEIA